MIGCRKYTLFSILSILLSLPFLIGMVGVIEHKTYVYHTGEQITVAWDHAESPDYFEAELSRWESSEVMQIAALARIPGTERQVTFTAPRSGHYMIRIRACNGVGCSDWADSTNPNSVLETTWMIYSFPAPITAGGIE